ncbi:MAG: SGNH/GDSL hydrolase family protein [Sphingomonas sp.]|uniref:SGNH/GDSL hydrolase family protein n=1 Tax=Sphingomonas sp. TaxID=28214 RepID=UPI001AC322CB|nr:SGNH/GDSL hydrolase family protein [Sphingomonas sp.]MBN8808862.1 SGNH/GDSL hydrolase family protein [Sphingomonas sp.]
MFGLGLRLPEIARRRTALATPTPSPTPAPSPTPTPSASIDRIVIEGDSITFAGGAGNDGFAWRYAAAAPAGKTATVNAQNSRTVGGAAFAGPPVEGADDGTPSGNTLALNLSADVAAGAQAILTMIGTNDLQTYSVANYRQRLTAWATSAHASGVRIGWSPPIPLCTNQVYANYGAFTAKRAALLASARDPAVWGQWADFYYPMGEQPDFNAADNTALINNIDGVHPTQAGQDVLGTILKTVADSLFDATRAGSTRMYAARWPSSETNLATATVIVRRIVVSGLDPAGTSLGASVTGAQISLNGGAFGAAIGSDGGNGYRLYNGDTIDLKLTTSDSNASTVGVDLTIGSETRTLTYRTVASVTPVAYAHGGIANNQTPAVSPAFTQSFGVAFAAAGTAVIALNSGRIASGMTVDGVAATRCGTGIVSGNGDSLDIWTCPIAAAGARTVVVTYGGFTNQTTLAWGVMTGADPTPVQVDYGAPANESQPHLTNALTVPASGLALAFLSEYGGAGATGGSVNSGTTPVDELLGAVSNGERVGLIVAKRTTSGVASFDFAFGTFSRGAVVFKAAGT